ncbi:zinc finger CCCH domain-containing protein 18-like isoform X4 [Carassius auratus]|uniref:Zinc finger CCCH domain-containing protein 18-like isoform X4 n=1 Tax=Carassius auratus TaxID=7957 RepID=A0A6P6LPH2_CARAU|nr:zinc finger CCCH domain-containing protein 18-like isoform X4 [Carassius auratus]
MDTPESPTQSPHSPEDELLESPESPAECDKGVSDSELLNDDENEVQEGGGDSDFEDGDRVAAGGEDPEELSDLDDYKVDREEREDFHQQDLGLTVRGSRQNACQSPEEEILETPRSPDPDSPGPEHERPFTPAEEERDEEDEATAKSGLGRAELEEEDDEEEEKRRRRRAAMVVSDLKDESSVSRDLDEHELDYDEEVPEEPSAAAPEEDEAEKGPAREDGEDEEEDDEEEEKRRKRKERKPILPPDNKDTQLRKSVDSREGGRRDSFRDKKKEEDDGEIDEGEIDDDDLEEGEVKDPMDRKLRPRPICRFFMKGNCTWGMICRFIHPGVNDKGNYSLITKPDPFSPNGAPPGGGGPHPLMPTSPWGAPAVEELPPPPPPLDPPVESAWERGLRHAKEVLKKATIRKEQEPDFEEKRFTVTIGEDDRDFDKENDFFRERGYRITREIRDAGDIEFRDPVYGDPYGDPYYDYEMEAFWRGGQYENFRVQYTETPLPYYPDRERERDPRERHRERERERERDHRERERRQREREREREREKESRRRKEEWERDRLKRDEKEGRPRERPPKETREKKDEKEKPLKPRSPPNMPPRGPMEPPPKKEMVPLPKRPDEWKDPWRRSKSPRRRPGLMGSPPRGRRRHRPSGSSVSLSNSSRSSSRSSSFTGSGSSRSQSHSRSSSMSSFSSHSSQHSSFSGSRSRSRSFSSSPSPTPSAQRNTNKNKAEQPPVALKGHPLKPGALPPPRREKGPPKMMPSPSLPEQPVKPPKPITETVKPPIPRPAGRPPGPREPREAPNMREGRKKERQQHNPPRRRTVSGSVSGSSFSGSSSRSRSRSSSASLSRSRSGSHKSRSLSVSSVSSVSSASSSSSSVRSADSDDMYADLASPVSSASSQSPTPGHVRKERAPPRDKGPNKDRGKPPKKDEPFKEERKRVDPSGLPPKTSSSMPRSGNRGHPMQPPPPMGPPGGYGSHKDIKLTLLNKQTDRGNRKRYFPADKERPPSPLSKRIALSPDRGRDRRMPGRPSLSPRMDRPKGQGPRPMPPQVERKRPLSPPPKSSGKGPAAVSTGKPPAPGAGAGSGSGSASSSGSGKPSSTLSRREELLKQLKAVEDAIARKRAKIPGK